MLGTALCFQLLEYFNNNYVPELLQNYTRNFMASAHALSVFQCEVMRRDVLDAMLDCIDNMNAVMGFGMFLRTMEQIGVVLELYGGKYFGVYVAFIDLGWKYAISAPIAAMILYKHNIRTLHRQEMRGEGVESETPPTAAATAAATAKTTKTTLTNKKRKKTDKGKKKKGTPLPSTGQKLPATKIETITANGQETKIKSI